MKTCPLGHKCDECLWLTRVQGADPQTGMPMDKNECAVSLLPLLLVHVAGKTDQVSATLEQARNGIIGAMDEALQMQRLEAAGIQPSRLMLGGER